MRADAAEKVDGKWLRDGQSYKTRKKRKREERGENERRWVGKENPLICSRNEGEEWEEVRRERDGTGHGTTGRHKHVLLAGGPKLQRATFPNFFFNFFFFIILLFFLIN